MENIETKSAIQIADYELRDIDLFSASVKERIVFAQEGNQSGDYLYINPMIFKHISENPFIQEKRTLPVEFPFQHNIRSSVAITIPDDYVIEELPKSNSISLENPQQGFCRYSISQANNVINLNYQFSLSKMLFPFNEYEQLKSLWDIVAKKNNEMIVLKKKAE